MGSSRELDHPLDSIVGGWRVADDDEAMPGLGTPGKAPDPEGLEERFVEGLRNISPGLRTKPIEGFD